jgi:carbonic anhydrase/acetyltransferase-like protein (isoleucine patch superfamily)
MPFFTHIEHGTLNRPSKGVVVFGNGGHARTVFGYLFDDPQLLGFVVDDAHVASEPTIGPFAVTALSQMRDSFPPARCAVLVALAFRDLNGLRQQKSEALSALGYELVGFVDRSVRLPYRCRIQRNAILLGQVEVHEGCSVGQGAFVSSGAVLGHDAVLEDYAWIGSGAVLAGGVTVGASSVLGMNASVRQNAVLGHHTLVTPNAFVNKNTEPYASIVAASGEAVPVDSRKLHRLAYR